MNELIQTQNLRMLINFTQQGRMNCNLCTTKMLVIKSNLAHLIHTKHDVIQLKLLLGNNLNFWHEIEIVSNLLPPFNRLRTNVDALIGNDIRVEQLNLQLKRHTLIILLNFYLSSKSSHIIYLNLKQTISIKNFYRKFKISSPLLSSIG